MPKIFKDIDIIVDNNCLILENDTEDEVISSGIATSIYENASKKNREVLWKARVKAHEIIESANMQAKEIICNAAQKAEDEVESIRKAGYEEGFLTGREEAKADMELAIDELTKLIGSIEAKKQDVLYQNENELKDLALNIAKKVIDTELSNNEKSFLSLYRKAVKQHNEQKWVKVTVSQYEAEFATKNADLLLSLAKGAQDIQISVLGNAPQGICIVETPTSVVDASVDTQLTKLNECFENIEVSM